MKITENLIDIRKYVRSGKSRKNTLYIDVHCPGGVTSLDKLQRYFNDSENTRYGSYNFGVDDKEVRLWIPEKEVSFSNGHYGETPLMKTRFPGKYRDGYENYHSISFCMMQEDSVGHLHKGTWKNAVDLCKYLCDKYQLPEINILPHFMLTWEKVDPPWFLKHPDELDRFRYEVSK